jgi:hypothetical protein
MHTTGAYLSLYCTVVRFGIERIAFVTTAVSLSRIPHLAPQRAVAFSHSSFRVLLMNAVRLLILKRIARLPPMLSL